MFYNGGVIVSRHAKPSPEPAIAQIAALIGDPGRAAMLCALQDGEVASASELAHCAGLAPNAASAHLAKLVAGGLLEVSAKGRQRLYRLSTANVARAIEALAVIAKPVRIVALSQSRIAEDLQCARSCYDHLAGRLGVAVTESLQRKHILEPMHDLAFDLTKRGERFFTELGIDLGEARSARRQFAKQCMDWSERRPHLAGALGAAFREYALINALVSRKPGSRALRITDKGRRVFASLLSIEV